MCVVAIIGILASVAIPAFGKYVRKAKSIETSFVLRQIYDAQVGHWHRLQSKTDRGGNPVFNWSSNCSEDYTNGPLCRAFTYSTAYDPTTGTAPRGRKVSLYYYPAAGVGFDPSPYDWYKSFHTLGVNLDSAAYYAYFVYNGAFEVAALCRDPAQFTRWTFTAYAYGDLDGDTSLSTFMRVGYVDRNGEVGGGGGIYSDNETE